MSSGTSTYAVDGWDCGISSLDGVEGQLAHHGMDPEESVAVHQLTTLGMIRLIAQIESFA